MKKLAFAALAVLMILSFVGCDGALHDTPAGNPVDLTGGAVPGDWLDPNWNNTTAWTTADKDAGVYTYEFTTKDTIKATGVGFKILNVSGDWDAGAFSEVDVTVGDAAVTLKKCGKGCGDANILGCKAATKYKLTATANGDGSVSVSVEELGAAPASFYLDTMLLTGNFTSSAWSNTNADLLLSNPTKDGEGNLVYTKEFFNKAADGDFLIKAVQYGNWDYSFGGKSVAMTDGGDYQKLDKNPEDGATVKAAKKDHAYRVYVKTTPAGDVYMKFHEVTAYTMKFKVVSGAEDEVYYINGTPWNWEPGWPFPEWNGETDNTGTKTASCIANSTDNFATANASGDAVFATTLQDTCSINDEKSFAIQVLRVGKTNPNKWTAEDGVGGNKAFTFKVTESGIYNIVYNMSTKTISVVHE